MASIRPDADSNANSRFDFADREALRGVLRLLFFFVAYIILVQILGSVFKPSRLAIPLLQFVPYCFFLASVIYRGRTLARFDTQTLLMAACLACIFIVFGLGVTRNLIWFNDVPLLGRHSLMRNEISSLAMMAGLASFSAAAYLLIQELLSVQRQLDDQVEKLQEALNHVKRLQGLLPICMYCHKIRTDKQSWQRIELYFSEHSDAKFTHGLCPECAQKHYPELKLGSPNYPEPPSPGKSDSKLRGNEPQIS